MQYRIKHLCARVFVFAKFRSEDILLTLTDFEPLRVYARSALYKSCGLIAKPAAEKMCDCK
jgi:hypothetical protein